MTDPNISTAGGESDHELGSVLTGTDPQHWSQRLAPVPSPTGFGGVSLPLDPVLALAGARWNDRRQLVRDVVVKEGRVEETTDAHGRRVRRTYRPETRERPVAPPGVTIEQARERGLDFFDPAYGWIRDGRKREQEYVENLGVILSDGAYEDEPLDDDGKER